MDQIPHSVTRLKEAEIGHRTFIFIGEGFTLSEGQKFTAAATKLFNGLMKKQVFKDYDGKLGCVLIHPFSEQSGITSLTQVKRTPFLVQKNYQGVPRLLGCADTRPILNLASSHVRTPAQIVVIVNDTSYLGSGGEEVFVSLHSNNLAILVHELGHRAGAADDYTNDIGYFPFFGGCNVALTNDPEKVPWKKHLGKPDGLGGVIGIYEGGAYKPRGRWRSTKRGCGMGALNKPFCVVCAEAVGKFLAAE